MKFKGYGEEFARTFRPQIIADTSIIVMRMELKPDLSQTKIWKARSVNEKTLFHEGSVSRHTRVIRTSSF